MALLTHSGRALARLGILLLLPLVISHRLPAVTVRDAELKVVFLLNFARFVDWPPAAFGSDTAPLVIGVLGDDPFGSLLDEAIRDEKIAEHAVVVRRFRRMEEIDACHIVFVGSLQGGRLEELMRNLKGRPVLTVGESQEFMRAGGMIRFVTSQNRLRLQINVQAARSAQLTISSKLLRSAETID